MRVVLMNGQATIVANLPQGLEDEPREGDIEFQQAASAIRTERERSMACQLTVNGGDDGPTVVGKLTGAVNF